MGGHKLTLQVDLQAGSAEIQADGTRLGIVDIGNPPEFLGPYNVDGSPIEILQIGSGGTACPAAFYAISFSPKAMISKAFGNCSDLPSITNTPHALILSLAAAGGGTDHYKIDSSGVHEYSISPTPIGPAPTGHDDLASLVLGSSSQNIFAMRAPSAAILKRVGPGEFNELKRCSIDEPPVSIAAYVVVASELSSSCRYPEVDFIFDHTGNVWIGTQIDSDTKINWYGNPPTAAIQAVTSFDHMPDH